MSLSDDDRIKKTKNVARYFAEQRHVGWVLFAAVILAGIFGYIAMPKRKDPFIKVRVAVAICVWPGAPPEKIEDLITRRIEEKVAQNTEVDRIEASSRTGVAVVTIALRDDLPIEAIPKAFDDIDLKLRSIQNLPVGASPIELQKDFGDTAALMLTVASPKVRSVELALRAKAVSRALTASRATLPPSDRTGRAALVISYPTSYDPTPLRRILSTFTAFAYTSGRVRDPRPFEGSGFIAVDAAVQDADTWGSLVQSFARDQVSTTLHPELWRPIVVERPEDVEPALTANAGHAYTYRELDEFTDRIATHLRGLSTVAKATRAGVLNERVYLDYSQERFAALGINPGVLRDALTARNVQAPSGMVDAHGRTLAIQASGEYQSESDIGDTLLTTSSTGSPVYVRDVVDVSRDYESPPSYLNYHTFRTKTGELERSRAITLAVQMKNGEQIAGFSDQVNVALEDITKTLPEDLVIVRTSDQPRQVDEKVSLFMTSLYEAIAIIVVVALVGFREWRSALVLALSIPLTLAMTFVFMAILGIDIQQMSIAALILALGLLVDDPVVAGDSIKHELDDGKKRKVAAWLGPTKLARAILFATIVNIVAYLPFLLIRGDVGHFIYSLPVVLTCSLVASRIVSMTFIPLLGYTILRPRKNLGTKVDYDKGALGVYRRLVKWCIDRRYRVLLVSTLVLAAGGFAGSRLRSSFFPQDYSRLFYIDIQLPEDSSIRSTREVAEQVDLITREVADAYGKRDSKHPRTVLRAITTFVGGGAPRFWYSLAPAQRQLNYSQIVVEVEDQHDTSGFVPVLQYELTSRVAGARIDVRQLENGKPVPRPVEVRFSGDDPTVLRNLAERAKTTFRAIPLAARVRDDWGEESFRVVVDVDNAKAGLAGVSSQDIALTSVGGFSGIGLGTLRDGERTIPIVARLRYEERGNAGDIESLYVLGQRAQRVPLGQVARVSFKSAAEKIQRRNQRRTISVSCFPTSGLLPSEVMKVARKDLMAMKAGLPPGYSMEIGGTEENVVKVQKDSAIVAVVSLIAILLTLVLQFRHALKPLLVFAAIPYGVAGALVAIVVMGSPFGFTAILGTISLIGVIVSHVIVLFDTIEEMHEHGLPLERALLDAGTLRLRPVLITVGATVLGLVPLALHGGPLWEPLCYAQIGGLTLATGITLLLVPILYAVFVLDLKWLKWAIPGAASSASAVDGGTLVMRRTPSIIAPPAIAPRTPVPPPNPGAGAEFDENPTEIMKPRDRGSPPN